MKQMITNLTALHDVAVNIRELTDMLPLDDFDLDP